MDDLGWIALLAGIQDGFGPSVLLAGAVLLVLYFWLERRGLNSRPFLLVFIVSVAVFHLLFHMGFLIFIFSKPVFQKLIYAMCFLCAVVLAGSGIVILYDGMLVRRGKEPACRWSSWFSTSGAGKNLAKKSWMTYLSMVSAAFLTGLVSGISAMDSYMAIISNNVVIPGRLWSTMAVLAEYTAANLWPVLLLAVFFVWTKISARLKQLVCAAVFLSAAASIFFLL